MNRRGQSLYTGFWVMGELYQRHGVLAPTADAVGDAPIACHGQRYWPPVAWSFPFARYIREVVGAI